MDLALREIDARNMDAIRVYSFVQDQLQYLGMEGVQGPLPLHQIKVGLEILDMPREDWVGLVQRVRILHGEYLRTHRTKQQHMASLPFAKRV